MGRRKGSKNKVKIQVSAEVGNKVEKITEKTGIKKVVKSVLGDDCGCDTRKDWLNSKINRTIYACFTDEQYKTYSELRKQLKGTLNKHQINVLHDLSVSIFKIDLKSTICSNCSNPMVAQVITWLNLLHESYER